MEGLWNFGLDKRLSVQMLIDGCGNLENKNSNRKITKPPGVGSSTEEFRFYQGGINNPPFWSARAEESATMNKRTESLK